MNQINPVILYSIFSLVLLIILVVVIAIWYLRKCIKTQRNNVLSHFL